MRLLPAAIPAFLHQVHALLCLLVNWCNATCGCCRGQQGQELLRKAISVCRQLPLAQLPTVVHQLLLWCSAAGLKAEALLVSSDSNDMHHRPILEAVSFGHEQPSQGCPD